MDLRMGMHTTIVHQIRRSGKERSTDSQYPGLQSDLRGESTTKRGKDGSKTGKKAREKTSKVAMAHKRNHPPNQSDSDGGVHLTRRRWWSEADDGVSKGRRSVHVDAAWGPPAGVVGGIEKVHRQTTGVRWLAHHHGGGRAHLSALVSVHLSRRHI
jgi:hypothetical protein